MLSRRSILVSGLVFAAGLATAAPAFAADMSNTPVLVATLADGGNVISSRLGLTPTEVVYEHDGVHKYVGPEGEISISRNSNYTYDSHQGSVTTGANLIVFGGSSEQPDEFHVVYKIAKMGANVPGQNTAMEQATGYKTFQLGVHQSTTISFPGGYNLTLYRQ
ncbi:MAG: hypothetical protein U7M05_03335 [Candidatus Igneacidithiobacillus chanchocoensis]